MSDAVRPLAPLALIAALAAAKLGFGAPASAPKAEVPPSPSQSGAVSNRPVESDATSSAKPKLRLAVLDQTIHGGVTVPTLVIATAQDRFALLPPHGWKAQGYQTQGKVVLEAPNAAASLTLRVVEPAKPDAPPMTPERFRRQLLESHPDAALLEESEVFVADLPGRAFEWEWSAPTRGRQRSRCAFVPLAAGYLELSLTSRADDFPRQHAAWNQVLLSLRRSGASGRLELPPVTPE
jgi:hypothetical protein